MAVWSIVSQLLGIKTRSEAEIESGGRKRERAPLSTSANQYFTVILAFIVRRGSTTWTLSHSHMLPETKVNRKMKEQRIETQESIDFHMISV